MKRKSIITIALIIIIILIVVVAFVLLNKGENTTDLDGTVENEVVEDADESNTNEEVSKEEEKVEAKTVTVEELMNYPESSEEDFDYSVDKDGTVEIMGYEGTDSVVVIPKQINGTTKIKIENFVSDVEVKAIRIPGNAELVHNSSVGGVFAYDHIDTVVIEEGVKKLTDYCFMSSKLKTIVLPDSIETIGATVFARTSIEEIKIPEKVTKIDQYLFDGMKSKNLTVELGDNISEIESSAFENNKDLTVTLKVKEGTTTYNTVQSYMEYVKEYKEKYKFPEFKIETK